MSSAIFVELSENSKSFCCFCQDYTYNLHEIKNLRLLHKKFSFFRYAVEMIMKSCYTKYNKKIHNSRRKEKIMTAKKPTIWRYISSTKAPIFKHTIISAHTKRKTVWCSAPGHPTPKRCLLPAISTAGPKKLP